MIYVVFQQNNFLLHIESYLVGINTMISLCLRSIGTTTYNKVILLETFYYTLKVIKSYFVGNTMIYVVFQQNNFLLHIESGNTIYT